MEASDFRPVEVNAFMPEPTLEPRTDGGPLVLVVEDDADSRDTIRGILEEAGYAVTVASNGRAALELLAVLPPPALLLVDLMMPEMDGPTLLATVASSAQYATIPVVVMTASGPNAVTSGLRYPLLRKPFDLEDLVRLVTTHAPRA